MRKARLSSIKALSGLSLLTALSVAPSFARSNPAATASSAANSAGTTVNNQNNSQVNTSTFYGFGPGINCQLLHLLSQDLVVAVPDQVRETQ